MSLSSSSSDFIRRIAFELTVFCTVMESILSLDPDNCFDNECLPSMLIVVLNDLGFFFISFIGCGDGQKQHNRLRIDSNVSGLSLFHLTSASTITQEQIKHAPSTDVSCISSFNSKTSQMKDSTMLNVRTTDMGPAFSYWNANVIRY